MKSKDSSAEAVRAVVARGYRRVLGQLAARDILLAATIAMVGPAVVLLVGTDYFPQALLWLFVVAGIASAAIHWIRSRPTPYKIAQRIDESWATEDQVSTAYHFLNTGGLGRWAAVQRRQAGELAAGGDTAAALPFRVPRAAYGLLIVLLTSILLFLARYGTQETLSLKPPLPPLILQALLGPDLMQQARLEESPRLEEDPAAPLDGDESIEPSQPQASEGDPMQQQIAADGELAEDLGMPEIEGLSLDDEFGDELAMDSSALGQEGSEGEMESPASEGESAEMGDQDPASEWSDEQNSLLDRLEEAFQNMMSALNMEPPSTGQPSQKPSSKQSEQASQTPGQGQQAAGQAGASEQAEGSEAESGETQDAAATQFSLEEGSESSEQPGETSVATAGSGDGSKALQEAALAEAMGKLAELYQQRAEEVSGEFTVETESASQKARTPYSPRQSGHADRGAALSRDEIPIAYRSYIKEYFSRIRGKAEN